MAASVWARQSVTSVQATSVGSWAEMGVHVVAARRHMSKDFDFGDSGKSIVNER